LIAVSRLLWARSQRIIATRFPSIHLFEGVAEQDDWDALERLANLTRSRVVQSNHAWGLFPETDVARGEGANLIMASYTYLNPNGSRFTDATFGAYYAARDLETAIKETVYHTEKFALEGRLAPVAFEKQVLEACISGSFHDLRKTVSDKKILSPTSYSASQPFAAALKQQKSNGIAYPSVRHDSGECVAVFLPRLVSNCKRTIHLAYLWDGSRVTSVQKRTLLTTEFARNKE
jgi:hypothetical protein